MRAQGWEWNLSASFLEIYNEQIRDLLREAEGSRTPGKVVKAPDHRSSATRRGSRRSRT